MASIAEMIRRNREETGLTREELADRLGLPLSILASLEEPGAENLELVTELAKAFEVEEDIFTGKKARPTKEELQDANATYLQIRKFILAPSCCVNPSDARELIGDQPFSPTERKLLLYLSTNALERFMEQSYSSFGFDDYLFAHHGALLKRLEKSLDGLPAEEREERLSMGRFNVFSCDSLENISAMVFEDFAKEFEKKLEEGKRDFEADLAMPFTWEVDKEVMKIGIKGSDGEIRVTIELLDVKAQKHSKSDG